MSTEPIPPLARPLIGEFINKHLQASEDFPEHFKQGFANILVKYGENIYSHFHFMLYLFAWRDPVWYDRMQRPELKRAIKDANELLKEVEKLYVSRP